MIRVKPGNVDDIGHPIHKGQPGQLPAAGGDAVVHVADAVAHEGAAVEHGDHQLVGLPGLDLVHEAGAGLVVRLLQVPAHLLLRNELVKTGVREEHHAPVLPILRADAGGLRSGSQLHRGDAPSPGQTVPVALGIGPGEEKRLEAEHIPRTMGRPSRRLMYLARR